MLIATFSVIVGMGGCSVSIGQDLHGKPFYR
jgi:hypothetical protein